MAQGYLALYAALLGRDLRSTPPTETAACAS
jgi:hypothetical protein